MGRLLTSSVRPRVYHFGRCASLVSPGARVVPVVALLVSLVVRVPAVGPCDVMQHLREVYNTVQ